MEQKRVSFEVAKAIKEAGYPQTDLSCWYDAYGVIFTLHPKEATEYYVTPTYLDLWLWLWREKKIALTIIFDVVRGKWKTNADTRKKYYSDPEEAIIAAIEYLVENNLIK